ncbi:hypothetical protein BpHYR1_052938 [Brachionus plicatilis]|uniref:Ion transport domain-containing protein n=1 Tax=Brachionus plicatilis TaxID=10195 RepID=A0A3M7RSI1_BRAPC|nr:hypothetical protein BpHYR1_052938 [Brachionus plicatilis]
MDKFYHFGKYIRNLEKNFSSDQDDFMSHFNTSYELGFFKTFTMMIGSLETENMGLNRLNSFSFINFFIYGFFIYFMSLLLLNIFTGISIDEVNELFKSAEKDDSSNKIDYILKIEEVNRNLLVFQCISFNMKETKFLNTGFHMSRPFEK